MDARVPAITGSDSGEGRRPACQWTWGAFRHRYTRERGVFVTDVYKSTAFRYAGANGGVPVARPQPLAAAAVPSGPGATAGRPVGDADRG